MATNNCSNTGILAAISDVVEGVSNRQLVSPESFQGALDYARLQQGWVENLGINYSSSTFSIVGANGLALSSTNYGEVSLPMNTLKGAIKRYKIDAGQSFIDATGASTIVGQIMGTTTGVAWNQVMPMYLYCTADLNDANPKFFICRVPHRYYVPPTANIGYPGSATASTAGSVFFFNVVDGNDYQGCPCRCIGSFKVQKDASDDWTVELLDNSDGIGLFKESQGFLVPTGQLGATGYIIPGAGTAPTFGIQETIGYNVNRNGLCGLIVILVNFSGGTPGAGTNDVQVVLPVPNESQFPAPAIQWANGVDFATATKNLEMLQATSGGYAVFSPGQGTNFNLTLDDLNGDVRILAGSCQYPWTIN